MNIELTALKLRLKFEKLQLVELNYTAVGNQEQNKEQEETFDRILKNLLEEIKEEIIQHEGFVYLLAESEYQQKEDIDLQEDLEKLIELEREVKNYSNLAFYERRSKNISSSCI